MNTTASTAGGYVGARERNVFVPGGEKIDAAFGASRRLLHREYFVNGVTSGHASSAVWVTSGYDLPNEPMIYGGYVFSNIPDETALPGGHTVDKTQLATFRFNPRLIQVDRQMYWLRDIVSASRFAGVSNNGGTDAINANNVVGVRLIFGLSG